MTDTKCLRCTGPLAAFEGDIGAGSRIVTDRSTRICGACGTDEAVREARGLAPIPFGDWPVRTSAPGTLR
ncbi:hypothetical protein ACIOEX_02415 [Streptomyces sp. NPDC087850]|uniref:hypothetical protein n=1 Tax=Streptomyces sp. NPDC087850 TaxID=3365809 RepID=UPI00381FDF08